MSKRRRVVLFLPLIAACAGALLCWPFRPQNFWQVFDTEPNQVTRAEAWLSSIDETETRQVILEKGDPALDRLVYMLTDQSYRPDHFHGGGGSLEMDPYVYVTLYTEDDRPPRTLGLYGAQAIEIDGKSYIPSHAAAGQEAIRDLLMEQEGK